MFLLLLQFMTETGKDLSLMLKAKLLLAFVLLNAAMSGLAVECAAKDGFTSIFNGRDFSGWEGGHTNGFFAVDSDGVLRCVGKLGWNKKGPRNIWTAREYTNFVLRFSFKFTPKTNNGIGIRAPGGDYITSSGMEVQLLEDESTTHFQDKRKIPDYSLNASIYGIAAAKRQSRYKGYLKPVGEWNEGEISAEGSRVRVAMNGVNVVDTDLAEISAKGGTPDGKPHPGIRRKSGHVSICWHNDTMWFRDLRIKEL